MSERSQSKTRTERDRIREMAEMERSVQEQNDEVRAREECLWCDGDVPKSDEPTWKYAQAGGVLAGPFCSEECCWAWIQEPPERADTGIMKCPFAGCSWNTRYDETADGSLMSAEMDAEMHYEREHAGRVRIQVTLETEQRLGGRDPEEVADWAFDKFGDEPWDIAFSRAEVVDEADDHTRIVSDSQ